MRRAGPVLDTALPAASGPGTTTRLDRGWTLVSTEAGAADHPSELDSDLGWHDAVVPGTVASAFAPDDLDGHPDYDARDWWYRCALPTADGDGPRFLRCDGLATLAEVWVDGEKLLEAENMFVGHRVELPTDLPAGAELHIAFRSLGARLAGRLPRPRWKTDLTDPHGLRWFRTTLLGRIPGWTPPVVPVGPWRPVWLESPEPGSVDVLSLTPTWHDGEARIAVEAALLSATGGTHAPEEAWLEVAEARVDLDVVVEAGRMHLEGSGPVPGATAWWPHTHGVPALHACRLVVIRDGDEHVTDCGAVGFRDVQVTDDETGFRFLLNGREVFCRGACWTPADPVGLQADEDALREVLERVVGAGANMLRVGGTMVYESDTFYRLCDELGILVWQDFMFANMDYPAEDPDFLESALDEAHHQVLRIGRHPCVVAWCGGSEVEQQAAMFGAPREIWRNRLFGEALPELVAARSPGTPYWPSTPTGGPLPFSTAAGLTHYYGVGAYQRPVEDARLAGVRFSPECLGFSNIPEPGGLSDEHEGHHPGSPAWKRAVPRDGAATWDFEDVRDHYLEALHGVDAGTLRRTDPARYAELSRLVPGRLMDRVFGEWRRPEDPCGGGLVWFLRDLRPGAGWGILDRRGRPKPVCHQLRRTWRPRTVQLLDRGLDGVLAVVHNEAAATLEGTLQLLVIDRGSVVTAQAETPVAVDAFGAASLAADRVLGRFLDLTWAYRFGPPKHEAVVARLLDADGELVAEDVYRPDLSRTTPVEGIEVEIERRPEGGYVLTLEADALVHDVRIDVRDHEPDDAYFTLTPGRPRRVGLTPVGEPRSFRGYVEATNMTGAVRLTAPD